MRGLMRELIVVTFGVLFSAIGFVNTFGEMIRTMVGSADALSFYLPLIDVVRTRVSAQQSTALLVLLALILRSSIGVG